jgi:hypothetical protein
LSDTPPPGKIETTGDYNNDISQKQGKTSFVISLLLRQKFTKAYRDSKSLITGSREAHRSSRFFSSICSSSLEGAPTDVCLDFRSKTSFVCDEIYLLQSIHSDGKLKVFDSNKSLFKSWYKSSA